uniref:DNA helicase n=1 Tax=Oryza rufipogon TaxID=4529 RepID=A0A0E0PNN3_ORYRU
MYDDGPRKGKPGGLSMDAATAAGLAAVWPEYFPEESEFAADGRSARLAADLVDLFSSPDASDLLSRVEDDGDILSLPVDFQQLSNLTWITEALQENPKEALLSMGAAVHLIVCASRDLQLGDINKINIRLYNHTKTIALKNLKAAETCDSAWNSLKSKYGEASSAAAEFPMHEMRYKIPSIQELASGESHEEGRVPRTIECELTEDLVDCCIPGETVTVTGIVKVLNNYMDVGGGKSKSRNQGLYYLYLEAISVRNSKVHAASGNSDAASGSFGFQAFTEKDLEFISKFKEEHGADVFRQILHSFCPSIYGHELVKAGITLALFGGVQKHSIDQNKVPVRGDIHAVVVGDPGLGKSQLLQAAAAVSPRGIYVCGNTTTNAGLTVAVVKDSMSNDYAFEAGAMVLADRGICCIDEFDKMSAEHQALLEAMEQQCVSVAKAGLVASLSARTSVLAAANPVGGHYDRAKTVNENLKMSAALLSRFDLVFILLDKPDELLDKRVSDHIIALHSNDGGPFTANKRIRTVPQFNASTEFGVGRTSLASRLRLHPEKDKDFCPLPGPLLRKYISYARSHVNPRISMPSPAADSLQKFYLDLRKQSDSADGTPITARQLESLVRLAEARARVDLREEVTLEDAKEVIDIMTESLYDKCVDEHGVVDFARSGGMSNQKQSKKFLRALNEQCDLQKKDCFSMNEMYNLADHISLQVANLDAIVESSDFVIPGEPSYMVKTMTAVAYPSRRTGLCLDRRWRGIGLRVEGAVRGNGPYVSGTTVNCTNSEDQFP